jgi:hypothetical protein
MFAAITIRPEGAHAVLNLDNICLDGVTTNLLFAAGPFHTCSAAGYTGQASDIKTALDYRRGIVCWGWGDFGQLDPPEIEHVTMLACGAKHACATNRQRLAVCWGSSMYGQTDLPRPIFNTSSKYCKFGEYITQTTSRVKYKCEDKV